MRSFARVRTADSFPGHCVRCPRNEDLLDLGAEQIAGYGTVHLCWACFTDLISGLGFVTPERYEHSVGVLQARVKELEVELLLGIPASKGTPDGNDGPDSLPDPDADRDGGLRGSNDRGAALDGFSSFVTGELTGGVLADAEPAVRGDADLSARDDADDDEAADGIDGADVAGVELKGSIWDRLGFGRSNGADR